LSERHAFPAQGDRAIPLAAFAGYQRQTGPFISQLLQDGDLRYLKRIIFEAEDLPDPDAAFERRLAMVLDGLTARIGRSS